MYRYVCLHIYICISCILIYRYACTCKYVYIYIYIHIRMYTNIYICRHYSIAKHTRNRPNATIFSHFDYKTLQHTVTHCNTLEHRMQRNPSISVEHIGQNFNIDRLLQLLVCNLVHKSLGVDSCVTMCCRMS